MNYGSTVSTQPSGRESTRAEMASQQLSTICDGASTTATRLEEIRDRAIGGRPKDAAGANGPAAVPAGTFGAIDESLARLERLLSHINDLANDIGRVI